MDKNSVIALLSGLIMLIVAGAVFVVSGSRFANFIPTNPNITAVSTIQKIGGMTPYLIFLAGPLADIYYKELRYSILSFVSFSAMLVGIVYQGILHGSGGVVPSLIVGTSAGITYLLQDVWVQPLSTDYKSFITIIGLGMITLTILVSSPPRTMFSNPLMDGIAALLLGAGIGEFAWVVTYNVARDRLPFSKR